MTAEGLDPERRIEELDHANSSAKVNSLNAIDSVFLRKNSRSYLLENKRPSSCERGANLCFRAHIGCRTKNFSLAALNLHHEKTQIPPHRPQSRRPTRLPTTDSDDPEGVFLLRAGAFSPEGAFAKTATDDYVSLPERDQDRHRVTSRDLLLQVRGAEFTAFLPPPDADEVVYVASTVFVVVKVAPDATPDYNHYLLGAFNGPAVQAQLQRLAKGTSVPMVSRKDLLSVEVPMPDARYVARYAQLVQRFRANVSLREMITNAERAALSSVLPRA